MLGLERGKTALYSHDPEWNKEAARTVKALQNILGDVAIKIEHVGSTAVNGIKAKPIIDVAVAVADFADIMHYNRELERRGFHYRYATDDKNNVLHATDFSETDVRQLLYACGGYYDSSDKLQTHFIHVVKVGSAEWRNYVTFRDYLNAHPSAAKEYENLKMKLCGEFADNRAEYTACKHEFIQRILDAANEIVR